MILATVLAATLAPGASAATRRPKQTPTPTTVPTTAPTTTAAPSAGRPTSARPPVRTGWITTSGTNLVMDGAVRQFAGVNAYELATQWGTNAGCGTMLTDAELEAFFGSLPANALVRLWAWQGGMATSTLNGAIDWRPLDRVVVAAAAHRVHLVMALAGQGGECDDYVWKDPAWYRGGYRTRAAGSGYYRPAVSYWDYVRAIVTRYQASPTIAMWEPVSEPEASGCASGLSGPDCSGHQLCPDQATAAAALRDFFDVVGGMIKQLDPRHLVESGALGSGQCGLSWTDYELVHASPGIDVASYHDYSAGDMPGDQWNGLAERFAQAHHLGKPLLIGEAGLLSATSGGGCLPVVDRASALRSKQLAAREAGAAGWLLWNWVPKAAAGCNYDIGADDPALPLVLSGP